MSTSTVAIHLETALKALSVGLSPLLPAEDGSKRVQGEWKAYQATPATEDIVRRWYRGGRTGNGLATGYGGLECLEFDDLPTYEAYKAAAAQFGIADLVETVEAGYLEQTPGGGIHWLYRCETVDGNKKLAERPVPGDPHKREVLIETRGTGGFVVTAPSCGKVHPTGKPYELIRGGLDSIVTISPDEREALWSLARSFDEMAHVASMAPTTGQRNSCSSDLKPGEAYEAEHSWEDVLEPFGWTKVFTRGDVAYWRRPGKEEGTSATTGHCKGLYVFTSSTSFEPRKSYTKFGAYAHLYHGGNHPAAARELARQGYGEPRKPSRNGKATAPSSNGNGHHQQARDDRPIIFVTTEEADVNDQAVAALLADPSIFQRNLRLVSIARDSRPRNGDPADIKRPDGTPIIRPIQAAKLREDLTRVAKWQKSSRPDRNGEFKAISAHPPVWSVNAILAREEWPDIRYLVGIIEAPTIRADGSVLETAGYDRRSGLLYVPNGSFPVMPHGPTQDDAKEAARVLLELVKDFPFKQDHKAAWLAALLTPLARFLIDGACPMFLFEANTSGAGKTLLCDVIAVIATGRVMTRTGYYHDPVEMDKQIVATALAGDCVVMFDNVENGGRLGNSSLDRALTGRTYRGRVLGKSEMTPDLDLNCVFFCTGNNLTLCGDVGRRIVPCRLESPLEHPEERDDFALKSCTCGCKGDLLAHVQRHREQLVVAALTILRSYILAGRPDQGLTPMDFTAWSGLIRNAVHWTTGIDPATGRKDLDQSDSDHAHSANFVEGWFEVQEYLGVKGMTSATLVKTLNTAGNETRFEVIRDAMANLWPRVKAGELPSSGSIGMKIQAIRVKPYGTKRFEAIADQKRAKVWAVIEVQQHSPVGESGEYSESNTHGREKKSADKCRHEKNGSDWEKTRQTHQTHQEPVVADGVVRGHVEMEGAF